MKSGHAGSMTAFLRGDLPLADEKTVRLIFVSLTVFLRGGFPVNREAMPPGVSCPYVWDYCAASTEMMVPVKGSTSETSPV